MRRLILGLALLMGLVPLAAALELRLEGVKGDLEKSLRAGLSIAQLDEEASQRLVRRRHALAEKELRAGLRAFGHYQAKIQSKLTQEGDRWVAVYKVDPGPRVRWQKPELLLEPAAEPAWLRAFQAQASALEGKPVDHRDYSRIKDQMLRAAEADGYLDARYTLSRLEVDPKAGSARMRLSLNTGQQYRFGRVEIRQEILEPEFLQRFNPIRRGDRFDTEAVLDLRLRLFDLDYFRDIEVDTAVDTEAAAVDLDLVAEAKPPQRWQIGLGYGTDTGPRISGAVDLRYINRDGHRVRGEARISEVKLDLSGRYAIPTGPEPGAEWSLRSQRVEEKLGDTEAVTLRTGLSRTRVKATRLWNYYLDYEGERFTLGGEVQKTDLVLPGISLTMREQDDLLLPRRGHTIFVDLHGASDDLLSSTSFVQARMDLRRIQPLSKKSRLILRLQAGANWLDDADALPVSQRFYAGGDNSIRGYSYRRVAPRNAEGEIEGGQFLQTATIEVDRLLWQDYGAALFYDIGSASNSWLGDLVSAVGLGFRWATPVGMLRLDVAHPLDDPDTRFQLHVGIGGEL